MSRSGRTATEQACADLEPQELDLITDPRKAVGVAVRRFDLEQELVQQPQQPPLLARRLEDALVKQRTQVLKPARAEPLLRPETMNSHAE